MIKNILKIKSDSFSEIIETTATILQNGGVIIYPTDTIYGFGSSYKNEIGTEKIFTIKGRDDKKALILLASSVEMVLDYILPPNFIAKSLMQKFWPGPVTLIFKTQNENLAFRVPQNNFCIELIKFLGSPITSTSVNRNGKEPITKIENIIEEFSNEVDLIIDGGLLATTTPSTIIDVTGDKPKILRRGEKINDIEIFISELV